MRLEFKIDNLNIGATKGNAAVAVKGFSGALEATPSEVLEFLAGVGSMAQAEEEQNTYNEFEDFVRSVNEFIEEDKKAAREDNLCEAAKELKRYAEMEREVDNAIEKKLENSQVVVKYDLSGKPMKEVKVTINGHLYIVRTPDQTVFEKLFAKQKVDFSTMIERMEIIDTQALNTQMDFFDRFFFMDQLCSMRATKAIVK